LKESYTDVAVQVGVALFGIAGITLSYASDPGLKLWSPVLGLFSQPFWCHMTIKKKLWGALFVTFLYTGAWSFGIYQNFFK
jgi:hypothetical protein